MVAEEASHPEEHLNEAFQCFAALCKKNRNTLKEWLDFHFLPENKEKHVAQMGTGKDVFESINQFFDRNPNYNNQAKHLLIEGNQFRYAFDVFYRGLLYDQVLEGIRYFKHPIRRYSVSFETQDSVEESRIVSWASCLSKLVEDYKISRNYDDLTHIIRRLKDEINRFKINWYEKECIASK